MTYSPAVPFDYEYGQAGKWMGP